MVKKSTVEKWGLDEFAVETNDRDEVNKISCKICVQSYEKEEGKKALSKLQGAIKNLVNKWI